MRWTTLILIGCYWCLVACDEGRESLRDTRYWIERTKKTPPSEFIEQLDDEDPLRRRRAIQSLVIVGPKTSAVVPALIGMLSDENAEVRRDAAASFASMAEAAAKAIAPLLARLSDPSTEVRGAVVFSLSRMAALHPGRLREPLITALRHKHTTMQVHAAFGLGQIGDDESLAALVDALGGETPTPVDVRRALAEAIAEQGERAVPFLELALEEPGRRLGAIETLARLGPLARPHAETIVAFLEPTSDFDLQRAISQLVAVTGVDPEIGLSRLRPLLASERQSVQIAAGKAVARLEGAALPMLREIIHGRGDELSGALRAVGEMTRRDAELEAGILALLSADDLPPDPKRRAVRALGKIAVHPDRVLGALLPWLQDEDARLRAGVASACGDLGPQGIGAVPLLVAVLRDDSDSGVRNCAADALGRTGRQADGTIHPMAKHVAVPALREQLAIEATPTTRSAIEKALESLQ